MRNSVIPTLAAIAFAATLMSFNTAQASTIYTDEAAFLTSLTGSSTTHNFDNLAHLTVVSTQFAGIDFQSTAQIYDEQNNPSGGAFASAPNVLLNFSPDPIEFNFDIPVDGVGFFNTSISDRERLELFDVFGNLLFSGEISEGTVNYLGYLSDTPIASGTVVGIPPQTLGTIFIDNISFGMVSTIPAPTTLWLFLPGLIFLTNYRNRENSHSPSARFRYVALISRLARTRPIPMLTRFRLTQR